MRRNDGHLAASRRREEVEISRVHRCDVESVVEDRPLSAPTLDGGAWIDAVVAGWRDAMLVQQHVRVLRGEIPAAQAPILADMAATKLRELLCNAEDTRQQIAYQILTDG